MRQQLHEIHKALAEHAQAYEQFAKAHAALHETLSRCGKGIAQAAPGDSTITGHLGQMAKACNLHKSTHDVHKTAHKMLHTTVHKAIQSIADRAGITIGYTNPNLSTQPDRGEQDLSSPGEGVNFPSRLSTSLQRGVTGKDLQKVMDVLQSRMPRFGAGTRQRVNKNANGNPHFGLNR
jgi:hypothetical protein